MEGVKMKLEKDKILIIGGYGAVGSVLSINLSKAFPIKIVVEGRSLVNHLQRNWIKLFSRKIVIIVDV